MQNLMMKMASLVKEEMPHATYPTHMLIHLHRCSKLPPTNFLTPSNLLTKRITDGVTIDNWMLNAELYDEMGRLSKRRKAQCNLSHSARIHTYPPATVLTPPLTKVLKLARTEKQNARTKWANEVRDGKSTQCNPT